MKKRAYVFACQTCGSHFKKKLVLLR
ncbi:TRASH domain-containing protein [uncultured Pseudacidovorax sp.]